MHQISTFSLNRLCYNSHILLLLLHFTSRIPEVVFICCNISIVIAEKPFENTYFPEENGVTFSEKFNQCS